MTDQARFAEVLRTADEVALKLRATAAERDQANQPPRPEIELLRENDLLQVQEPVAYGGSGLNYAQAAQITRRIARGDTSIAHLIGYHYAQTRIDRLFGTPEQAEVQSRRNAQEKLFWGGVQNPRGGSAITLTRDGKRGTRRRAAGRPGRGCAAGRAGYRPVADRRAARRGRGRHLRDEGHHHQGGAGRDQRLFEIQGSRATSTAYGFDRHWRNVRTHTVHDPVAYKAREVGDWALNRRGPEFSLYR